MKGKAAEKKPKAIPVVLVDESEELTSTVIISKMFGSLAGEGRPPHIFAGGFKHRPEEQKEQKGSASASSFNPPRVDKMTVYDEFGIINGSTGKKKYRDDKQEEAKQPARPAALGSSSSGGNPWRQESKQANDSAYEIARLREREQSALHVRSSLEVINLENIEAKLEAHRQTLRPLEEQYRALKGGAEQPAQGKERLRFNAGEREMQPARVYELIKETQERAERPEEEQLLEEMWEQRKKQDPRLADYDFKYQQYLVEKEARKMIGSVVKESLFTWDKYAKKDRLDRRKAARQKSNGREAADQRARGRSSLSPAKQDEQVEGAGSEGAGGIKGTDIQEKIASKDDKFIGKFIMAEIDTDKRGVVSKEELAEYLAAKEHLVKGYHIDLKWLHTDLDNFESKRKGVLNQQEVIRFLATLDSLHHPALVLKEVPTGEKDKSQALMGAREDSGKVYSTFFKENAHKFERVFGLLDLGEDKIVKREELIENILIDGECSKILDRKAIVFKVIGKSITFRQILSFILEDYRKERSEKLRKSKEYITLERFNEYFQVPESLDLARIDRCHSDRLRREAASSEIDLFDIEEEYLLILKDIFDAVPRIYQDYIVADDFVSLAQRDPQVLALSDELCRIESVETGLAVESIKSTLLRLRKECDEYGTWEMVRSYFSRRGRPLEWDFALIQKKKEVRGQLVRERAPPESGSLLQGGLSPPRPALELADKLRSRNKNSSLEKYTVPAPFNITDQRRQEEPGSKLSSEELEVEQLKRKFKANPLNAEILSPKPDLIQGKVGKCAQRSAPYHYEDYENDRIERVLRRAQEEFEEQEQLKEIKRLAEVRANSVKIDMSKKLEDVVKEQKRNKERTKPKPTVPQASANLYPQNPQEEAKKKVEKYRAKLEREEQAAQAREGLRNEIKERAKERNKQALETGKQKKRREEEEREELARLEDNSYRPQINQRSTTEEEKEALRRAREERERRKLQEQEAVMEQLEKKKREKLSYVKPESGLELDGLADEEILGRLEEVELEDLLLDERDRACFRKEFQLRGRTRKERKERLSGQAGRERAAMEAEERRLGEEKRELKERKQSRAVREKVEQAKELKKEVTTAMNVDTNFHRSNALRRYRALMEGKEPNSEYDAYSRAGEGQRSEV